MKALFNNNKNENVSDIHDFDSKMYLFKPN